MLTVTEHFNEEGLATRSFCPESDTSVFYSNRLIKRNYEPDVNFGGS